MNAAIVPMVNAAISAFSSTTLPLATFTRCAVAFIDEQAAELLFRHKVIRLLQGVGLLSDERIDLSLFRGQRQVVSELEQKRLLGGLTRRALEGAQLPPTAAVGSLLLGQQPLGPVTFRRATVDCRA